MLEVLDVYLDIIVSFGYWIKEVNDVINFWEIVMRCIEVCWYSKLREFDIICW